MKLRKKQDQTHAVDAGSTAQPSTGNGIDRRTFLRRSGLAAGGTVLGTVMSPSMMKKSHAATKAGMGGDVKTIRSVCTHCSVGCGIYAEVENGVWTGQEPAFDHPFNLGAHCAKGASVREHGHGERRLKYPTKLVNGKWQRVSWEQAINEIGDQMLDIRKASGPDSVYWLGSAKFNNEQSYLFLSMLRYGEPITWIIKHEFVTQPQ